jgi:hypothetical protein
MLAIQPQDLVHRGILALETGSFPDQVGMVTDIAEGQHGF